MSGASARLSRLHTPVETGTPPHRRSKVHFVPLLRRTFGLPQKLLSISLLLLFDPQTLRWFTDRPRERFLSKLHFVPLLRRTFGLPQKLHFISLLLLFDPQTLRWFANRAGERFSRRRACSAAARGAADLLPALVGCWKARITIGIVTHPAVGMCYNSVTNHVFVNLTISLTGVTLARARYTL